MLRRLTLIAIASAVLVACNANSLGEGVGGPVAVQNSTTPVPSNNVGATSTDEPVPVASLNPTGVQSAAAQNIDIAADAVRVAFLPVIGVPQSAANSLFRRLSEKAGQSGIQLATTGQTDTKYHLKGFFSPVDDGSGTILTYIWDVRDPSGRLLHRISGQERGAGRGSDPWRAVDDKMLTSVADRTVEDLKSWLDQAKS